MIIIIIYFFVNVCPLALITAPIYIVLNVQFHGSFLMCSVPGKTLRLKGKQVITQNVEKNRSDNAKFKSKYNFK